MLLRHLRREKRSSMTNNSSSPIDPCGFPDSFWTVKAHISAVLTYVSAFVLIVGLFGHILSFRAFYREARKTTAYMYQAMVAGSDIIKMVLGIVYFTTFRLWSGFSSQGAHWFMRNKVLMWFAAHVDVPLANSTIIFIMSLTVAMAADRLFAIARPYQYGTMNHKRIQLWSFIASLNLAAMAGVFDAWRYYLDFDGDVYKIVPDEEYMARNATICFVFLRNLLQAVSVVALIVMNILAVRFFRKSLREQTGVLNDKRLMERKKAERTLLILSLTQCVLTAFDGLVRIVYTSYAFAFPVFLQCGAKMAGPLSDFNNLLCTGVNFYVALCISQPYRRMIRKSLPFWRGNNVITVTGSIRVAPTTNSGKGVS